MESAQHAALQVLAHPIALICLYKPSDYHGLTIKCVRHLANAASRHYAVQELVSVSLPSGKGENPTTSNPTCLTAKVLLQQLTQRRHILTTSRASQWHGKASRLGRCEAPLICIAAPRPKASSRPGRWFHSCPGAANKLTNCVSGQQVGVVDGCSNALAPSWSTVAKKPM